MYGNNDETNPALSSFLTVGFQACVRPNRGEILIKQEFEVSKVGLQRQM